MRINFILKQNKKTVTREKRYAIYEVENKNLKQQSLDTNF